MRRMIIASVVSLGILMIAAFLIPNALNAGQHRPSEPVQLPAPLGISRLPQPTLKGNMSVEEALNTRRSVREYSSTDLSDNDLSQIMWAAQGITGLHGFRTAPSAGARYPIDVYVVNATGVYHYLPLNHSVEKIREGDVKDDLMRAAFNQNAVGHAPLDLVITGVYERTAVKYGDRAERYVCLEAGHVAQNVLLQCTALHLGAVPVGGFDDAKVQDVLGIGRDNRPLYIIPIGHTK
ncbi:MAG TPA: SagB/ThcOx family dehydrogenase [Candidatus Acidoferrales bacterium]|nr:SagB/ThcOx family dehydrogenase [Candidatus Acidoferrales bacterium]